MTSADAAERNARNSTTAELQVAPENLLALAESFDKAADKGQGFLESQSDNLTFDPMGNDAVSELVAERVSDSATGYDGAVPTLRTAVQELRASAVAMRELAATYGFVDESNANALPVAGSSS